MLLVRWYAGVLVCGLAAGVWLDGGTWLYVLAMLVVGVALAASAVVALVPVASRARAPRAGAALEARLAVLREWVAAQDHPDWEAYERLVAAAYAEEDRRQHTEPPRTPPKSVPKPAANRAAKPQVPRNVSMIGGTRPSGPPPKPPPPPWRSDHTPKPAVDVAQRVGSSAKGLWQIYAQMGEALVPAFRAAARIVTPSTYRSLREQEALERAQWAWCKQQAEYTPGRLRCTKCGGAGTLLYDGQARCTVCGHLGAPMVQCSSCHGQGKVLIDIGRAKIKCGTCRGRGLVPAEGMATKGERR